MLLLSRTGVAAASAAALIFGAAVMARPYLPLDSALPGLRLGWPAGLSIAAGGLVLLLLLAATRPSVEFVLSRAALTDATEGLRVSLSSKAIATIVRRAAYRTDHVLGCRPRLRLGRRGWGIGADIQVTPAADIARAASVFEKNLREDLEAQTHMTVDSVRVHVTFDAVEPQRIR